MAVMRTVKMLMVSLTVMITVVRREEWKKDGYDGGFDGVQGHERRGDSEQKDGDDEEKQESSILWVITAKKMAEWK